MAGSAALAMTHYEDAAMWAVKAAHNIGGFK